jgi:hypothetical protein
LYICSNELKQIKIKNFLLFTNDDSNTEHGFHIKYGKDVLSVVQSLILEDEPDLEDDDERDELDMMLEQNPIGVAEILEDVNREESQALSMEWYTDLEQLEL